MIRIHVFNAHPEYKIRISGTVRLAHDVLDGESSHPGDVNIIFIDDKRMTAINRQFLGRRYPTDVISFQLSENRGELEGELYVNLDQCRRQAVHYKVPFKEEHRRLVVHGLLHLLGYDDDTPGRKSTMTMKENEYLNKK